MTVKTNTIKVNGKAITELTSKELTDTVRAMLAYRKTVNDAQRKTREAAKAERTAAAAAKRVATVAKLEAKLAALKAKAA